EEAEQGAPPTLTLAPGRSVGGRVLLGEGEPLAAAPLILQGSIGTGRNTIWFGVDPRLFATAADGTFRIPGRKAGFPFRLSLVLSPAVRARLSSATKDGPPIWPLAMIGPEHGGALANLGDVRVDLLHALDIRVEAPDGTPPGSVRLAVVPLGAGSDNVPHEPDVVRTDRHGRVRLLSAARILLVHATTRAGAAWAMVGSDQTGLVLRIDTAHAVRFRVVDLEGRPVSGAHVGLVGPQFPPATGPTAAMAQERIRNFCSVHAVPYKSGRTDADGHVDLVMPAVDVQLDLSVDERELGISRRFLVPFPRERDPGPIVLEVRRSK
ncbi:MAG: hypothetical protein KDC98_25175, partial [Planctomycetes bacterium]|nr:hypothetical protein [Planctomycetota bacterium]